MSNNDKQIEIELRSVFDRKKYNELKEFLGKNAEDLGEDDKDVFFFLLPDKITKATHNVSKKRQKL